MALNVNRNVEDVFYRYKMPRLIAKVEGKGNGIKTVIPNMTEIAKALNRPPTYPTKYFGCELGAQTRVDETNERYIVNGEHDGGKLQDLLDGFIRKYVLCPSCDNPETSLQVRKNTIYQKCKACGYAGTIETKSRLATFIVKNPPPVDEADSAAGAKRGAKKVGAKDNENGAEQNGMGELSQADAAALQTNGHMNGKAGVDEHDEWTPDTAAADAVNVQLTGRMKELVATDDLEKPLEDRLDMFYNYVIQQKTAGTLNGKDLVGEADRLDVRSKAPLLLWRALIAQEKDITTHKNTLLRFTLNDKKAQRYLLGGVEQLLCGDKKGTLLARTPVLLKLLYDEDIVEEEVLLEWAKKPSKKYVSKKESTAILEKAQPFITWLQEAEEETDEDSEDDDVEFTNAAGTVPRAAAKPIAVDTKDDDSGSKEDDDEDGINIDDI